MPTTDDRGRFSINTNGTTGGNEANGNGRDHVHGPETIAFAAARHAGRGNAGSSDLTLADVVALIRTGTAIVSRRWVSAAFVAVLVAAVLGFAVSRIDREFTAVTTMVAESELDEVLRPEKLTRDAKTTQDNFLHNRLSLMKSRRFSYSLANEFSDEEMREVMGPYLEPGLEPTAASFERFLALRMGANRERGREFFVLHFRHRDRNIALMVANRMAATYIKVVQVSYREANIEAAELLSSQARQLETEIAALEDEKRDYRKKHSLVSLEENQGLLAERLRRIDQSRAEHRIALVRSEIQLQEAEAALKANPMPFDNPMLAQFGNNQELRQELDGLIARREVLAQRYGPNHAKMRDNEVALRTIRERIANNFDLAYRELKSRVDSTRAIENQLQEEFIRTFGESVEIARLADHFRSIEGVVQAKRETLDGLLRRVNNAAVVGTLPTDGMRIVDPAYIAQSNARVRMVLGGFVGIFAVGAFVGYPLLRYMFDGRINVGTDVEKELRTELLGGVPRLTGVRPADRPHVVRDNANVQQVEPFMAIIAQLELSMQPNVPATYLVTSAASGEGKSVIASNLAAGFSRLGKRTLLVDADFRNPMQSRFHSVANDRGFLTWVRAGFPPEKEFNGNSVLRIHELPDGTHLLPTGGDDLQPTKFLLSAHTAWLFGELQKRYDVLVIDTPPAGMFRDALILAGFARETLLVAREAKAPIEQIRLVIASLERSPAPIRRIIINDFSSQSMDPRLAYDYTYGPFYAAVARKKKRSEKTNDKLASTR